MAERVPAYAMVPLKAFLAYLQASLQSLDLSIRGISALTDMPSLADALATPMREALKETWSEDKHQARMAAANVAAAFAEIESKAGFPFMHEFALVGLWGAIEATVEDLIVALLLNEPSLLQREQFAKIKISLAEYELLDKEERMRFLVIELQRTLRTGQRQGVASFESLLECVGLSGQVSDAARKSFWEMNHLRNVIVHRRSLADRTFVNACPWLNAKIGERVRVNAYTMKEHATMLSGMP